jgi:hypothetical protein
MRCLRKFLLLGFWLALICLLNYELVQKAPQTALGQLPGSSVADRADRRVKYEATTGLVPLDRLLHEGREAWRFYRDLTANRIILE